MTRKLIDPDREAVDLIFDRITSASQEANDGEGFVGVARGASTERLQAVEQILHLLDHMPATEPPADLVVRTLQHVAQRTGAMTIPAGSFIDPSQPTA